MVIVFKGMSLDHKEWARLLGITEQTLRWRIAHWGLDRALTTPKRSSKGTRGPNRRYGGLSQQEKSTIAHLYARGFSEDKIAGALGTSRKLVSRFLIGACLKQAGSAPKRLYSDKDTFDVQPHPDGVIVTMGKVA